MDPFLVRFETALTPEHFSSTASNSSSVRPLSQSAPPVLSSVSSAFQREQTEKRAGILRACADDIGAALKALKFLVFLKPIFDASAAFAGLHLKPAKCHLIVGVPLSPLLVHRIQQWLQRVVPDWANFQIGHRFIYIYIYI